MFETLKNALKVKDIRMKLVWTLVLLVVFRIGCYIPVPGLTRGTFIEAMGDNSFLQIMSAITGDALSNGTLFALGIGPYINSSIIVQLLCFGIPALERLSKEGEDGRKKIAQLTRYIAILLAIIQSVGIIVNFAVRGSSGERAINIALFGGAINETMSLWLAGIYMTVVYTAGACIVMWLGDRMTEKGIGNGMSMIIFVGIISSAGNILLKKFSKMFGLMQYEQGETFEGIFWSVIAFVVVSVFLFAAIVTVDLAERKIPVQYAKQVKGRKQYGGQRSEIPMRISASGVMPLIFAFAIISVPSMILSLFFPDIASDTNNWWVRIQSGDLRWIYTIILCLLIFAFSFFYAQLQFNPDDVAKSIQQNGGFIQGIRPGRPTAEYLKKISGRITLFGAIYLSLVAFIPSMVFSIATQDSDLVNVFSTTGILIVVSVAMDFDKQLQSQLVMKTYKGFLK